MTLTVYTLFALDLMGMSISFGVVQKHVLMLGGSLYYAGILTSMTAALSFFWTPIAGRLSDTRKPTEIMIWCLLVAAIGNVTAGFSSSLYLLTLSRIIQVSGSPLQGLFRSAMTNMKSEDRSKMLNKIGIITSASFIVGSLVGGFLSEFENGIKYRYCSMALFNLISIVLVKQLPDDNRKKQEAEESSPVEKATKEIKMALTSMAKFFTSDRYGNIFMVKAIQESLLQFRLTALLYQFTVGLGFSGRQVGYTIATIFLWNISVNVALLKCPTSIYPNDRGGRRIIHALLLGAASTFGHALCPSPVATLFFLLLGEASNVVGENAATEIFLEAVREAEKGVAVNCFGSVRSLSELFVPLLCNASLGAVGVPFTFLGGGVMTVAAGLGCFGLLGVGGKEGSVGEKKGGVGEKKGGVGRKGGAWGKKRGAWGSNIGSERDS